MWRSRQGSPAHGPTGFGLGVRSSPHQGASAGGSPRPNGSERSGISAWVFSPNFTLILMQATDIAQKGRARRRLHGGWFDAQQAERRRRTRCRGRLHSERVLSGKADDVAGQCREAT